MTHIRKWSFLAAYSIPALVLAGHALGGPYNFLTPIFVFGVLPLLDWAVGRDMDNLTRDEYQLLRRRLFYRLITRLYVPVQLGIICWGAWVVSVGSLTGAGLVGFILSVGMMSGGVGITIAHELGHGGRRLDRFLSKALLMSVGYMHFIIEHNQGHHARVATWDDPASARLGEPFYRFFARTLIGGFRSAWSLESRRLNRAGSSLVSPRNQMIWFTALPIAFAVSLGFTLGWTATLFFFGQSLIAALLLESVNYVEHYGLVRRELEPGRYEKVAPRHSWNASEMVTNSFLFNLQKHADHHAHAGRPYQTLRNYEESPQLPTGYPGMILLAFFPPLWRKVMDPRVAAIEP